MLSRVGHLTLCLLPLCTPLHPVAPRCTPLNTMSPRSKLTQCRATHTITDHAGKVVHGHNGGVWEWTDTPFEGYEGFVPSVIYPGYSADFFDGKHFVVVSDRRSDAFDSFLSSVTVDSGLTCGSLAGHTLRSRLLRVGSRSGTGISQTTASRLSAVEWRTTCRHHARIAPAQRLEMCEWSVGKCMIDESDV